jgi:hypothetical protein
MSDCGCFFHPPCRPLNEPYWQPQPFPQSALPAVHPAGVGFMVVSGQMQKAVKDENLDLRRKRVSLASRLPASPVHADGNVACQLLFGSDPGDRFGGESENVGGLVFAQELAIQPAEGRIRGEKDRDLAA